MKGWEAGEGNGNPLQYSCLENPLDRGAWWATAHGVTQSQTRLHTHAHTKQASPSHGKGPDQPSACVAGLLQRQLQREEAGVFQTVSTRCAARPYQSTCRGPVPPGTRNKRVQLTLKKKERKAGKHWRLKLLVICSLCEVAKVPQLLWISGCLPPNKDNNIQAIV